MNVLTIDGVSLASPSQAFLNWPVRLRAPVLSVLSVAYLT